MRQTLLFSIFIFLLSFSFAVTTQDSIKLLAVTQDGLGIDANLTVNIKQGNGSVWSSVDALVGTSTQNTEKTAVALLSKYNEDYNEYDYFFSINSGARVVDGPSAGLPTALLLIYMMQDKELPNYVSGTGTISSVGSIGKVGGILEKTKYASQVGIKIFFIPESELEVVVKENEEVKKVNLSNYAYEKYGIKVVGVKTIDEVLNYDLKNIEKIKIEEPIQKEKSIYNPPISENGENLKEFHNYISQYIEDVKTNTSLTENVLKNTDLKDNDLLNELYSNFDSAKENYDLGKAAYEKNYLYSAANYLFQANITLNIITDIISSPDTLTNVQELNDKATQLQKDYNISYTNMPCNNYEWYIASQERYLWAQSQITFILSTPGNDKASNISRLEAYEYAKEWFKIAKLFNSYIPKENCYLNEKPYSNSANQMLEELRKADALVLKYDLSDSEKWINGAKDANKNSWIFTTLFEGATALAVVNSFLEIKDENLIDIKDKTQLLITELEKQNKNYIWFNLYLQHANYLYNEAMFFEDKDQESDALNSYQNAYRLANFSKNLFDVVDDIERNKTSLAYVSSNNLNISKGMIDWDLYKTIAFVFLLIILILSAILIIFYNQVRKNSLSQYVYSIDSQINQLKTLETQIQKDFRQQKISNKNYTELSINYKKEIDFLEDEKKAIKTKISEISELESTISNKHKILNELKDKYSRNVISLDDYLRKIKEFDYEMKIIKRKIDNDYKSVSDSAINKRDPKPNYNYKPPKKKK